MFSIFSTTTDAGPVLALSGEVDLASAGRLCEVGDRLLAVADGRPLTIDLAAVTFLDAAGLGALVTLSNVAADMGKPLRLHRVPGRVTMLVDITGLAAVLPGDETSTA